MAEEIDAKSVCRGIRNSEDLQTIKVIAIANGLSDSEHRVLLEKGFDGYVPLSADAAEVIHKIEEVTAIIY
jgi:CheY-like chemotaxis protein